MNKILITGGAGFIGSHLVEYFLNKNYIVHIFDNFLTGFKKNIPNNKKCFFHKVDVNNFELISKIMIKEKFDFIYHYSAVVGVNRTLKNPDLVLNDLEGLKNIFNLSVITNVKKIYYSSSSEIYGEPIHLPQHENTTPLNSRLPYAVIKNVGECFCKTYNYKYGLNFNIFRFFNTFGRRQSKDFVISKFLYLAKNNSDITIYGNGKQTRTFCYISDNIESTTSKLLESKFNNQVINIGSDIIYSINDVAKKIIEITGSKSKIIRLAPLKDGDMTRRQPDIKNMKKILGKKLITLEEGLKKIIKN
ncbi:MAG: epimerase [Parcubacteria group bacterium]|jgi:UDP-glucose 4-epimerase|nr:epimerase [Parcubacteria group bacterium]|tara:strand:+ start:9709 stop:10620 length:912 start_codon:yes stop_codon:yes gene_type:complete